MFSRTNRLQSVSSAGRAAIFVTMLAASGLLAVTSGAIAQTRGIGSIIARTGLTPLDIETLEAASKKLYEAEPIRAGKSVPWRNEKSGAEGTVRLDEYDGACIRLGHTATVPGKANKVMFVVLRCRGGDGQWRMQEVLNLKY